MIYRCKKVCVNPTEIGCRRGDVSCQLCIVNYLNYLNKIQQRLQCPKCQEYVLNPELSMNKLARTQILKLKVRCIHSKKAKTGKNNKNNGNKKFDNNRDHCEWQGKVKDLQKHLKTECQYVPKSCVFCKNVYLKKDMNTHIQFCSYVMIKCKLGCGMFYVFIRYIFCANIPFFNIYTYILYILGKKIIRNRIDRHYETQCEFRLVKCEYHDDGCKELIQYCKMKEHLKENELIHHKMRIKTLSMKIHEINDDKNKLINNNKVYHQNMMRNNDNLLLLIFGSNNNEYKNELHCVDINNNYSFNVSETFNHNRTLFNHENSAFHSYALKKHNNNNYLFCIDGSGENNSICCEINSGNTKVIPKLTKVRALYNTIYSDKHGLLLLGGFGLSNNINVKKQTMNDVIQLKSINDKTWNKLPNMNHKRCIHSSVIVNDDKLFVFGGKNDKFLNTCEYFDFNNNKWNNIKSMNHSHGGCGTFYDNNNKNIYIIGGANDDDTKNNIENSFFKYDIHKNDWYPLPSTNYKHICYPHLTSYKHKFNMYNDNNILIVFGGENCFESFNKGKHYIEWIDIRESTNKWNVYKHTIKNIVNIGDNKSQNVFLRSILSL